MSTPNSKFPTPKVIQFDIRKWNGERELRVGNMGAGNWELGIVTLHAYAAVSPSVASFSFSALKWVTAASISSFSSPSSA